MPRWRFLGSSTVRNSPRLVAPRLVGAPLASPVRRGVALALDVLLFVLVVLPLLLVAGFGLAAWHAGGLASMRALESEAPPTPEIAAERTRARVRILRLFAQRRPDLVPADMAAVLESGDDEAVAAAAQGLEVSVSLQLSSGEVVSSWDEETGEVVLTNDVLLGPLARPLALAPVFLLWFTAVPRLMRGWSPGKWLAGARVVRANGGPFSWWDAFSRAGGYWTSIGTFGVGFLEAAWDPNVQASHDKLADTFVVRAPRLGRPRASG